MTGWRRATIQRVPRPFVAYLRVYQPLSAFSEKFAARLTKSMESGPLQRCAVGDRERELWLRSQLAVPRRLLPGELPDGRPAPNAPQDVMVLDPAEISDDAGEMPEQDSPLVCPLDLRPRSAAALVGFLSGAPVSLKEAAVEPSADVVRSRASSVMAQLPAGAVHSVSSTYTVPLPWFALVEQHERVVTVAPRESADRQVRWTVPMAVAMERATRAHQVVVGSIGEDGPAKILADTVRWLEHFDEGSAVELDYGGLTQLLSDEQLLGDHSAQDVQGIIDALDAGDAESVAERYERLRDFWAELAMLERNS